MKKICWITPDYFIDSDMQCVPKLDDSLLIHWIVYLPSEGSRYKYDDFKVFMECKTIKIKVIQSKYREKNPLKIFEYLKFISIIRNINPDAIYINMVPSSPWQIPMYCFLPKSKTIVTAHQGKVHEGMGHYRYYNFLRDIVYKKIKHVNMFSKSQALLFRQRYPNSIIYQWPLGLKNFGVSSVKKKNEDVTTFLSFGIINYAKHIDLLLDAANMVYERGIHNFVIVVKGNCTNWNLYKKHIKYPHIIEADIRMIENSEIPDLFTSSDYFVQPYRVVSQSGPFKIALNYNLPIITSNLTGFLDEMVENVTGFIFETNNVTALADTLEKAIRIKQNKLEYSEMKKKMRQYVENNYSSQKMTENYISMFNDLLD